jgi:hypothetical protein
MKDEHWNLIEKCWADAPTARPAADFILQAISKFYTEEQHHGYVAEGPMHMQVTEGDIQNGRKRKAPIVADLVWLTCICTAEATG